MRGISAPEFPESQKYEQTISRGHGSRRRQDGPSKYAQPHRLARPSSQLVAGRVPGSQACRTHGDRTSRRTVGRRTGSSDHDQKYFAHGIWPRRTPAPCRRGTRRRQGWQRINARGNARMEKRRPGGPCISTRALTGTDRPSSTREAYRSTSRPPEGVSRSLALESRPRLRRCSRCARRKEHG
jgi:hypothetical protein